VSSKPGALQPTILKDRLLIDYQLPGNPATYVIAHVVPVNDGGSATSALNLYPLPLTGYGGQMTRTMDADQLHDDICAHKITIAHAAEALEGDWLSADPLTFSAGSSLVPVVFLYAASRTTRPEPHCVLRRNDSRPVLAGSVPIAAVGRWLHAATPPLSRKAPVRHRHGLTIETSPNCKLPAAARPRLMRLCGPASSETRSSP
jgi:hypothetical protein